MAYNISNSNAKIGSYIPRVVLASIAGIDGKVVAETNLLTVPAGKSAIVEAAIVRVTVASAITVAGIAGIKDTTAENGIINGITFTGLDAVDECYMMVPSISTSGVNLLFSVPAGNVIVFNLFSAFTATTATLTVDLLGYLY